MTPRTVIGGGILIAGSSMIIGITIGWTIGSRATIDDVRGTEIVVQSDADRRLASTDEGPAGRQELPEQQPQPRVAISAPDVILPAPMKKSPVAEPLSKPDATLAATIASVLGLQRKRIESLIRLSPDAANELREMFVTMHTDIATCKTQVDERRMFIAKQRWEAGQFEVFPNDVLGPQSGAPGEILHYSGVWDPVRKVDVQRLVRIRPGDDPEFDSLRSDFDTAVRGARSIINNILLTHGVR